MSDNQSEPASDATIGKTIENSADSLTPGDSTSPPVTPPGQRPNFLLRVVFPVAVLVVAVIALTLIPRIDSLYGKSIPNLISVSLTGLCVLMLAGWLIFWSGFKRRTIVSVLLVVALMGGGFAASLKSVEFDGDMALQFHYRWEQNHFDKLAQELEGREKAQPTSEGDQAGEPILAQPTDMPAYRGVNRDGVVEGPVLNTNWDENKPEELWRFLIGEGYSQFAVVEPYAITMAQRPLTEAELAEFAPKQESGSADQQKIWEQQPDIWETVSCYETTTGAEMWTHAYIARFYEAMGGLGPRATPTINQGQVFSFGATGVACCLELTSGELVWQKDLLANHELANVTWGMSSSPLIIGEMVVFNPGGPEGNGMVALDRNTGEIIWEGEGYKAFQKSPAAMNLAGYSSPVVMTLHGVEQIVLFDGFGLGGYVPDTGEQLWNFEFKNGPGVNVAQPILLPSDDGDARILISSSYGNGSSLIQVNFDDGEDWSTEQIWHDHRLLRSKFTSPIHHNGYVYGLDEGYLTCIDPTTGERAWKRGRYANYGHGQILLTNGLILVMAETGDLALVEANPKEFIELASMPVLTTTHKVWNPPALVNGIAYLRDHREMVAIDLRRE